MNAQNRASITLILIVAAFVTGYYLVQPSRPDATWADRHAEDRGPGSSVERGTEAGIDSNAPSGVMAGARPAPPPSVRPVNPLRRDGGEGRAEGNAAGFAVGEVPTLRFDGDPETRVGNGAVVGNGTVGWVGGLPGEATRTSRADRSDEVDVEAGEARDGTGSDAAARYVVRPGDTLESIARATYGHLAYWQAIAWANPDLDPRRLRVGQSIRLPREDQLDEVRRQLDGRSDEPTPPKPEDAQRYTVRSGDTLSHISQRFYGTPNRWRPIFNANRDVLPSPQALRPGMELTIPPDMRSQ